MPTACVGTVSGEVGVGELRKWQRGAGSRPGGEHDGHWARVWTGPGSGRLLVEEIANVEHPRSGGTEPKPVESGRKPGRQERRSARRDRVTAQRPDHRSDEYSESK